MVAGVWGVQVGGMLGVHIRASSYDNRVQMEVILLWIHGGLLNMGPWESVWIHLG